VAVIHSVMMGMLTVVCMVLMMMRFIFNVIGSTMMVFIFIGMSIIAMMMLMLIRVAIGSMMMLMLCHVTICAMMMSMKLLFYGSLLCDNRMTKA
jgi:hypothetical protein